MPIPPIPVAQHIFVPVQARGPIASQRYCRNQQFPDANAERELATQLNQAIQLRPKEVFRWQGSVSPPAGSSSTRNRWRFCFKTSPLHADLKIVFVMALESPGGAGDPQSALTIYDATGVTVIGSADVHYGLWNNGSGGTPDEPFWFAATIVTISGCAQNTIYAGVFSDLPQGRLQSAVVYEEADDSLLANGYLWQGCAQGVPIAAADRAAVALLANARWQSGNQLWNWCTDVDANVIASTATTLTNVIDGTTSVTAASAGVMLNLANHATATQAGVPVTLYVYGSSLSNLGWVKLLNSSGAVMLSVQIGTGLTWYNVTGTLPAADLSQYVLAVLSNGGGSNFVEVYAASLIEVG